MDGKDVYPDGSRRCALERVQNKCFSLLRHFTFLSRKSLLWGTAPSASLQPPNVSVRRHHLTCSPVTYMNTSPTLPSQVCRVLALMICAVTASAYQQGPALAQSVSGEVDVMLGNQADNSRVRDGNMVISVSSPTAKAQVWANFSVGVSYGFAQKVNTWLNGTQTASNCGKGINAWSDWDCSTTAQPILG